MTSVTPSNILADIDARFRAATQARDDGDAQRAIDLLKALIVDVPPSDSLMMCAIFVQIGYICEEMLDQSEIAVVMYRQAVDKRPHYDLASLALFHVLARQGDWQSALSEATRFLASDDSAEYREIFFTPGYGPEPPEEFAAALVIIRGHLDAHQLARRQIEAAKDMKSRGEHAQAISLLTTFLGDPPSRDRRIRAEVHTLLATLYSLTHDGGPESYRVESHLRQAVNLVPRLESVSLRLFKELLRQHRDEDAMAEAVRFVELRNSTTYRDLLIGLRGDGGRSARAADLLEVALAHLRQYPIHPPSDE
jgi:tetratricopeptide (TPR) repeat protein